MWHIVKRGRGEKSISPWSRLSLIHRNQEIQTLASDTAPSDRLVRVAFGKEPFRGRAGLYGLVEIGEGWNIADGVHMMMFGNQQLVNGILFRLHGYRFVLFLGEEGLPSTISAPALDGQPEHAARTLYPLMAVRRTIGDKYLSQVILSFAKTPQRPNIIQVTRHPCMSFISNALLILTSYSSLARVHR